MNIESALSIVLAVSTVIYTVISLMLYFESRKVRLQKITPFIVAYLDSIDHVLKLHIKNIGEGVAEKVEIKLFNDYNQFGQEDQKLSEIGIIKDGINVFPPQYELKYYVDLLTNICDQNKGKESVKLEIKYESSDRRKFVNCYELPFGQMFGQIHSDRPEKYMQKISDHLKKINDTLNKK